MYDGSCCSYLSRLSAGGLVKLHVFENTCTSSIWLSETMFETTRVYNSYVLYGSVDLFLVFTSYQAQENTMTRNCIVRFGSFRYGADIGSCRNMEGRPHLQPRENLAVTDRLFCLMRRRSTFQQICIVRLGSCLRTAGCYCCCCRARAHRDENGLPLNSSTYWSRLG